jgi:hypothetical protein
MREKTRHRLSVLVDFVLWTGSGVIAVAFAHGAGANIWFELIVGAMFTGLACAVVVFPKVRRYMRKQYPGGNQIEDPGIVGKYTILEDEIQQIRCACIEQLRAERPAMICHNWLGRRWDAMNDGRFVFAVLPGLFSNRDVTEKLNRKVGGEGEFFIEACVVVIWAGNKWQPTSMLLPGNISEAMDSLKKLIDDNQFSVYRVL